MREEDTENGNYQNELLPRSTHAQMNIENRIRAGSKNGLNSMIKGIPGYGSNNRLRYDDSQLATNFGCFGSLATEADTIGVAIIFRAFRPGIGSKQSDATVKDILR